MKTITFRNGDHMPLLGLGTYLSSSQELLSAIQTAVREGYRLIDGAPIYKNEKYLGEALKEVFNSKLVKREEMFITSKLWNNNHAPEHVEEALKKSLHDLQLDYVDLYLIHWPIAFRHDTDYPKKASDLIPLEECPLTETWHALEEMQHKGLCKHIGVSNFSIHKLKEILAKSTIKPEMNQIELHPYLQQKNLLDFCQSEDIFLTAYSPISRNSPINNQVGVIQEPIIKEIARTHMATPAQIILAWAIQRGITVIPKSVNPERIRENFRALSITLTSEEMNLIATLDSHVRRTDGTPYIIEGGPYSVENIWDGE